MKNSYGLIVEPFREKSQFTHFNCGDEDFNDFIKNDALNENEELRSVTYFLKSEIYKDKILAYFSLLNNSFVYDEEEDSSGVSKTKKKSSSKKQKKSILKEFNNVVYPAVKLARLAVNNDETGKEYGSTIIDWIKIALTEPNISACRFIVVDAINSKKVRNFYEKNDFFYAFPKQINKGRETILMLYDLNDLKKS